MRRLAILLFTLAVTQLAAAKRIAPANVDPITYDGIRYIAPNDEGRRGYVEAWDVGTNQKLWELTVFTNRIDPNVEEDVQWLFIKSLTIQDHTLLITREDEKAYQVDLKTKGITQSDTPSSRSAGATRHMPDPIKSALTNGSVGEKYDLFFRLNPSWLDGDFNGDGKMDAAVLVRERSTGKIGIAIIDGATAKITVLGAGVSIGNGGDDFEWMDSWQVYSRKHAAHATSETPIPHFRGDALLVEKSEAASALIYWNGKRYIWSQRGD